MSLIIPDIAFYHRDALIVAPDLVGKLIIRTTDSGEKITLRITEAEAYLGTEDTACHASKGKTPRNELLWREAGTIYVYLCYGMHNMMNIITGEKDEPQGVLIRACEGFEGPGKLTKRLMIDRSLNGMSILGNPNLMIADDGCHPEIITKKRVGIDYAEEKDKNALWRFCAAPKKG